MSVQDVSSTINKVIDNIKLATVEAAKATAEDNKEVSTEEAKDTLEIAANVKEDVPKGERDISYQILSEPLRELVGPEGTINNFIEFLRVQSGAFIKDNLERIGLVSNLAIDPNTVNNEDINNSAQETGSRFTDAALSLANPNASGNIFINSNAAATFKAQNVNLEASSIFNNASVFAAMGKEISLNANNGFSVTSKTQINNIEQTYHQGNTVTSYIKNNLLAASDSTRTIAKLSSNVGTVYNETAGGEVMVAAENRYTNLSNGDAIYATKNTETKLIGEGITTIIGGTNTSGSTEIAGGGDGEDRIEIPVEAYHQLVINNKGGTAYIKVGPEGKVEIIPNNSVQQVANWCQSSAKFNINTGSQIYGSGNNRRAVFHLGPCTFVGTPNFFASTPEPIKIDNLPGFPRLPKIPTEELESCIPEKFRGLNVSITNPPLEIPELPDEPGGATGPRGPRGSERPTTPGEATDTTIVTPDQGEADTTPTTEGQDSDEDSVNSVQDPTKESKTNPDTGDNTKPGEALSNLPVDEALTGTFNGTTISSPDIYQPQEVFDDLAKAILTGAAGAGAADDVSIEVDKVDLDKSVLIKKEELVERLQEIDIPEARVDELITPLNNIIKTAFTVVNEEGKNILENLLEKDKLTVEDISDKISKEDREVVIKFLNEFPQTKKDIYELIILSQEAIGFLGSIGGLVGGILPGIGSLLAGGIGVDIIGNVLLDYAIDLGKTFLIRQLENFLGDTPFSFLIGVANNFLSGKSINLNVVLNSVISTGLTKLLPSQYSALVAPLTSVIEGVITTGELDFSEVDFRKTIESVLRSVSPVGGEVVDLVNNVEKFTKQIIADYNTGDLNKLLTGTGIRGLLTTILGQGNSGQLDKIFSIVEDTLGIVQAIQALPELLQLLDDYNVPVLDQISTVINCLDLFDKLKDLLDNFKSSDNPNARVARTVQELPRLIQGVNTINEIIRNPNVDETAILPPAIGSVINIDLNLSRCFKVPQLTVDEATVEVLEQRDLFVFFKPSDLLLIQNNIKKRVAVNDQLYVKVNYFIHPNYGKLVPYVSENQFTQSIFKYNIYEYSLERNLGVASLIKEVYFIKLQNEDGFIYKFPITAIGNDLTMVIDEAYLNK